LVISSLVENVFNEVIFQTTLVRLGQPAKSFKERRRFKVIAELHPKGLVASWAI
jgi:hypothetical protein